MFSLNFLGIRLGVLFAVVDFVCGIFVFSFPAQAMKLLGYLTHMQFAVSVMPFSAVNFAIGIISWFVIGFVIGLIWEQLNCGCCCKQGK